MSKFIFVTGGVVSGLGKGIAASSIGVLLKASGLKVFMQKFDPYLNIDPGTMSPYQHGEVYVTADGAETDLDLGHYERFIDENLSQTSNVTAGKVYQNVLQKERQGAYNGKTVQVVPHVTNEIKQKLYEAMAESKADVIITEIGGTVGDIESLPFLEAIRQLRQELGRENVIFLHLSLVPYIEASHEYKTKPTQHSVQSLLAIGIQPDMIFARSHGKLDDLILEKIALFCNVNKKNVIVASDVNSIYEVPLKFYDQGAHKRVLELLQLPVTGTDIKSWQQFVKKIHYARKTITIGIIGKYVEMPDAYLSVTESLKIAGYENETIIKIVWIKAHEVEAHNYEAILANLQGILVPGGFGERGFAGKILTVKYAREHNIPFLGICFGMQAAVVEFARHVCNLPLANSAEFDEETPDPIISLLKGKNKTDDIGGTLRLGNYKASLVPGTLAAELYNSVEVFERHRHRYEFNNKYRQLLEKKGLVFSGIYQAKDLVEIIELPKHKFFIASQFHPEFTSRPNKPNPLFFGFIKAICDENNKNNN